MIFFQNEIIFFFVLDLHCMHPECMLPVCRFCWMREIAFINDLRMKTMAFMTNGSSMEWELGKHNAIDRNEFNTSFEITVMVKRLSRNRFQNWRNYTTGGKKKTNLPFVWFVFVGFVEQHFAIVHFRWDRHNYFHIVLFKFNWPATLVALLIAYHIFIGLVGGR